MIDYKHSFLWSFIQPVCIKCPLHVLNVGTVLSVGLQRLLRQRPFSLESSQTRMKYRYLKAMWYGNHMRVWEKIVLRRQCWSLIGNTGRAFHWESEGLVGVTKIRTPKDITQSQARHGACCLGSMAWRAGEEAGGGWPHPPRLGAQAPDLQQC